MCERLNRQRGIGRSCNITMGVFGWFQNKLMPVVGEQIVSPHNGADGSEPHPPPALPSVTPRDETSSFGPLDREELSAAPLAEGEDALLARIDARAARSEWSVPRLPSTAGAVIALAHRPGVEIAELADAIRRDPMLTSETLRIANSAMFATKNEADNVQQAVMRIGLRSVRGVVLSAAMRGSIPTHAAIAPYATEVWRESQSVARLARTMGVGLGFEADPAYVLGLLNDVGKVVLLGVLQAELGSRRTLSAACVHRAFQSHHEAAGRALAIEWRLPAILIAVIGNHHDLASNSTAKREAALALLAHSIDLYLSSGDEERWQALPQAEVFDVLGAPEELRHEVLIHARHAWEAAEEALAVARANQER